jgi:hypothetical protein
MSTDQIFTSGQIVFPPGKIPILAVSRQLPDGEAAILIEAGNLAVRIGDSLVGMLEGVPPRDLDALGDFEEIRLAEVPPAGTSRYRMADIRVADRSASLTI